MSTNKTAVIQIGPFQYRIEEGKTYKVPRFEAEEGKDFTTEEVIMVSEGENTVFGTPFVDKSQVTLKIISQGKGEKIKSFNYRAKTGYRRTTGHRKLVTEFSVEKISTK